MSSVKLNKKSSNFSNQDFDPDEFKVTENDWQLNVLLKLNLNPSSVIKFKEDPKSKRVIVTETKNGLQLLKGLAILAVDGQDVSKLDCLHLEEMLANQSLPLVIKFGNEQFESERWSDFTSSLSLPEDPLAFVSRTSSVTFDIDIRGCNCDLDVVDEVYSKEFKRLTDDESISVPHDWQPISLDGTFGNMSKWSKKCRERSKIITELVNTEKSYILGLENLNHEFLEMYIEPLKKIVNIDLSPFKTKVESLIFLHDKIYKKLCTAENICTVFQQECKFLKLYKSYVKDYGDIFTKLQEAKNKKRAFKFIFLNGGERLSQDPLGYFSDLGITIVQRIPRYILFLQQLVQNTPIEHPMYPDVEKSLREIKGTCGDINEYQRWNEFELIKESTNIDYKTLKDWGVRELVVPSRRLIRVGDVGIKVVKSSRLSFKRRSQERLSLEMGRIVMCNDLLIITIRKKNLVKRVFMLDEIEAELNMESIKPWNNNKWFEKVFEVVLKNRSVDVMIKLQSTRQKPKLSFKKQSRDVMGLGSLSKTAFEVLLEEDNFNIYLSTLEEAQAWTESIMKYSNQQSTYVN